MPRGRTKGVLPGAAQNYTCRACGKTLSSSSALQNHDRIHTGVKPFECDLCGKTFSQRSSLSVHKQTHSGLRPHMCGVCRKRFYQSSDLKRHMQSHLKQVANTPAFLNAVTHENQLPFSKPEISVSPNTFVNPNESVRLRSTSPAEFLNSVASQDLHMKSIESPPPCDGTILPIDERTEILRRNGDLTSEPLKLSPPLPKRNKRDINEHLAIVTTDAEEIGSNEPGKFAVIHRSNNVSSTSSSASTNQLYSQSSQTTNNSLEAHVLNRNVAEGPVSYLVNQSPCFNRHDVELSTPRFKLAAIQVAVAEHNRKVLDNQIINSKSSEGDRIASAPITSRGIKTQNSAPGTQEPHIYNYNGTSPISNNSGLIWLDKFSENGPQVSSQYTGQQLVSNTTNGTTEELNTSPAVQCAIPRVSHNTNVVKSNETFRKVELPLKISVVETANSSAFKSLQSVDAVTSPGFKSITDSLLSISQDYNKSPKVAQEPRYIQQGTNQQSTVQFISGTPTRDSNVRNVCVFTAEGRSVDSNFSFSVGEAEALQYLQFRGDSATTGNVANRRVTATNLQNSFSPNMLLLHGEGGRNNVPVINGQCAIKDEIPTRNLNNSRSSGMNSDGSSEHQQFEQVNFISSRNQHAAAAPAVKYESQSMQRFLLAPPKVSRDGNDQHGSVQIFTSVANILGNSPPEVSVSRSNDQLTTTQGTTRSISANLNNEIRPGAMVLPEVVLLSGNHKLPFNTNANTSNISPAMENAINYSNSYNKSNSSHQRPPFYEATNQNLTPISSSQNPASTQIYLHVVNGSPRLIPQTVDATVQISPSSVFYGQSGSNMGENEAKTAVEYSQNVPSITFYGKNEQKVKYTAVSPEQRFDNHSSHDQLNVEISPNEMERLVKMDNDVISPSARRLDECVTPPNTSADQLDDQHVNGGRPVTPNSETVFRAQSIFRSTSVEHEREDLSANAGVNSSLRAFSDVTKKYALPPRFIGKNTKFF